MELFLPLRGFFLFGFLRKSMCLQWFNFYNLLINPSYFGAWINSLGIPARTIVQILNYHNSKDLDFFSFNLNSEMIPVLGFSYNFNLLFYVTGQYNNLLRNTWSHIYLRDITM